MFSSLSPLRKGKMELLYFVASGYKISKGKKQCADAYFTTKMGLGVADGVGGWSSYGIDPSSFSQQLMDQ
jgi:hypothetical protein